MQPIASGKYSAVSVVDDGFTEYEAYSEPDWDGYGAKPITIETVRAARSFSRLLPADGPQPDVAPGADGTIGFEWRFGPMPDREFVLIDVGPGTRIVARRISANGRVWPFAPTTITTGAKALIQEIFSA
ncbi:hypothetical protein JQ543_11310 [Bradyrhizobium diazoefficiens]|nr:hypothetical protein [Bradyrhizobium diazoefficiens]MBR0848328.1 hypothetical protein [Bradyrhizobium diazoefficiens]